MPNPKKHQEHKLAALTALAIIERPRRREDCPKPSDEELVALVRGRLVGARRDQVLYCLASDRALYEKWLMLLETLDEIGASIETSIVTHKSPNRSLIKRLQQWIDEFESHWIAGGIIALGLSVLLFTFTPYLFNPKTLNEREIANLIETYSAQLDLANWAEQLKEVKPKLRGGLEGDDQPYSNFMNGLITGVSTQLHALDGEIASQYTSKLANDIALENSEKYKLGIKAGKLGTLLSVACENTLPREFFEEVSDNLKLITNEIRQLDTPQAKSVSRKPSDNATDKDKACLFGKKVVDLALSN